MSAHWSDAYVGRPYVPGVTDCAELAAAVQREVFGRPVEIPAERPDSPESGAALIARLQHDHAVPIAAPVEGCAVLLRRGAIARPWHIGTYFERAGEGYILHSTRAAGAATVVRLRDIGRFGFQVEGFYAWK